MSAHNLFETLIMHTEEMHEHAKVGDWDQVRLLDAERMGILKKGLEQELLVTHESGLNSIQLLHERIIDLAKAERNVLTREYKENSDRLQYCQAYLETDRQSEIKE